MKERPIIFSSQMIPRLLDGSKTQDRRIIKDRAWAANGWLTNDDGWPVAEDHEEPSHWYRVACPYGVPGDRLWVRERCQAAELDTGLDVIVYNADGGIAAIHNNQVTADQWTQLYNYRNQRGATVPSIHMPKWAARIWLEITDVRAQRVQEISDEDVIAEGCMPPDGMTDRTLREFRRLWDSIYSPDAWDRNPWVWALTFKRIERP